MLVLKGRAVLLAVMALAVIALPVAGWANGDTLDAVRERGAVVCGVNTGLVGFSASDAHGNWTGLDVDFCRAVAAAIFDDPSAVRFVPTTAQDRFDALASGDVDILARNSTWTMHGDTARGLHFVGVNYYDGQGFMVRRDLGVSSVMELDGTAVCALEGTTTELNLRDYFLSSGMEYEPVLRPTLGEALEAYEEGLCRAYTSDASGLYSIRLRLAEPADHMVLPEIISKEPLAPAVRSDDEHWYNLVRWVHNAMLNAEELGVERGNAQDMRDSPNREIRRLLGTDGDYGSTLGLDADWAYNIVRHVGNYGESFERNVGIGSALNIDRGLNRLWVDGGIQYAPAVR